MQQQVSVPQSSLQRSVAWLTRRFGRRPSDLLFRGVTFLLVLVVLGLVVGVAWVLVTSSLPTIAQFGFSFLTNQSFDPFHNIYVVEPALFGPFVTCALRMVLAIQI